MKSYAAIFLSLSVASAAQLAVATPPADAVRPADVELPIEPGSYVNVDESCAEPISVLHYDGTRIRWLYEDAAQSMIETPRRVLREGDIFTLESMQLFEVPSNSDVPEMAPQLTRIEVRDRTHIAVSVQDDVDMRQCASASLPTGIQRQLTP